MQADFSKGTISDLADINPTVPVNGLSPNSSVSFIPMADVSDKGQWTNRQTRKLREVRNGYTVFKEGDVLFAKITPCMENGKGCHAVGLQNGVGFGSTEFHVLRAKSGADARFVFHWSQSEMLRRRAEAKMIGSAGQQRVPADFFETFEVSLFEADEQRHIAEVLDAVDAAIQRTDTLINKLKWMKDGVLNDLLTRGLDRDGKLRDPARHPEQFKDSPLGLIPKYWEVTGLSAKRPSSRPYIKTGPFGSTLKGEHWVERGIPVITIGALGEGSFIKSELLFITQEKALSLSSFALEPGDLVFSRVADVGRSVIVREEERGWIISSNLMRISLNLSQVNPYFVHLSIVQNSATREQIRRLVNAGGRDVANTAMLSRLIFAWPLLEEQNRIVDAALTYEARVSAEETNRDKLIQIKKGLMHDLLTGRVRVPATKSEVVAV